MGIAQTYVGIDVAKDSLDVAVRPTGEYLRASNDEGGARSLVERLGQEGRVLVVVEATGGLGRMVECALDEPAGRVPDIGGPEDRGRPGPKPARVVSSDCRAVRRSRATRRHSRRSRTRGTRAHAPLSASGP